VEGYDEAEQARRELARVLRPLPGFAGVGLVTRDGQFGLKVNFQEELSGEVPTSWQGMTVTIDVVGSTRAY